MSNSNDYDPNLIYMQIVRSKNGGYTVYNNKEEPIASVDNKHHLLFYLMELMMDEDEIDDLFRKISETYIGDPEQEEQRSEDLEVAAYV